MLVIDHYYKLGVLGKKNSRWTAEDRLRVALTLYGHFHQAGLQIKSSDPSKIKVDQSIKSNNEISMFAEARYRQALRVIPQECAEVVVKVVIINDIIKGQYKVREKQKELLCRGLDALCDFYTKRSK